MASGQKVTLNFAGDSLIDVTIDEGVLNALVENKAAIKADGGRVILTAKAADAVLSAQVNNSGIIQARTMAALTGGGSVPAQRARVRSSCSPRAERSMSPARSTPPRRRAAMAARSKPAGTK